MRNKIMKASVSLFTAIVCMINAMCINISAEDYTFCYVLIEAEGKAVISSENENTKVPVGTMAKLMTVLLTAEYIENGNVALTDMLKTSSYANSMQGAQIWLMPGEEITVDELLKAVIIGNANDASVVLAEKIAGSEEKFTEMMNSKAKEIGMDNTVFTNCSGYYDENKQISTAYDLAVLCSELAKYDFLREYFVCWRDFVRDGKTELVNSNEMVKYYKGICGYKASFTESSGYCIASAAEKNGITYITVILGCDDKNKCFTKSENLLNSAFSEYTVFTPELPDRMPTEIAVRGGLSKTATIEYGNVRKVVLPNSAVSSLSSKVIMPEYIYAPVQKGYKVGEIQFFRNDKLMFCVDIVTKETINEINIIKSLGILLKKLLTF